MNGHRYVLLNGSACSLSLLLIPAAVHNIFRLFEEFRYLKGFYIKSDIIRHHNLSTMRHGQCLMRKCNIEIQGFFCYHA